MFTPLEALKRRAEQELEQVKQVPASLAVMLIVGFGGGWYVNDLFHEERFAIMESRLQHQAGIDAKGTATTTENAPSVGVIGQWGGGDVVRPCVVDIAAQNLAAFEKEFDVALICGLTRNNVDRLADTAISKSPSFTIDSSRPMHMEAPLTQDYLQILANIVASAPKDIADAKLPTGVEPVLTMAIWFEVVLIPKGTTMRSILSVSDVIRMGGRRHSSAAVNASMSLSRAKAVFDGQAK